ncbi:acyl-CoA thioesterase [Desulfopila inferna]|uniref:acyl-CoA thioesterase n=1 Tax=Desulfopila inferna TaxID=468528 RepID=UPI001962EDBF|nr:thioesterase family protein [Desulfopila inferna]MBM9603474.1 acyl-CoA thioesterase [Desulfopila inferna]
MKYLTEIKVRGYHADFYGHVNNARYLEFFEEDRWARLEDVIDLREFAAKGYIFLVVNINVNYRRAVAVGETVLVTTGLEKISNKSVALKQEIVFKESKEVAADAIVTFVIRDATGKAAVMEGDLLEDIKKLAGSE